LIQLIYCVKLFVPFLQNSHYFLLLAKKIFSPSMSQVGQCSIDEVKNHTLRWIYSLTSSKKSQKLEIEWVSYKNPLKDKNFSDILSTVTHDRDSLKTSFPTKAPDATSATTDATSATTDATSATTDATSATTKTRRDFLAVASVWKMPIFCLRLCLWSPFVV